MAAQWTCCVVLRPKDIRPFKLPIHACEHMTHIDQWHVADSNWWLPSVSYRISGILSSAPWGPKREGLLSWQSQQALSSHTIPVYTNPVQSLHELSRRTDRSFSLGRVVVCTAHHRAPACARNLHLLSAPFHGPIGLAEGSCRGVTFFFVIGGWSVGFVNGVSGDASSF